MTTRGRDDEGTDLAGQARRAGRGGPRPRSSRPRPTRSSRSPRPRSAAPTCTCTRCSGRTSPPATSSATRRWASSRRSAPRSPTSSPATGSSSRSTSPAALLDVQRGLYAQCETTQVRDQGKGASLFGYTCLYGAVPGGQAEYLRVPQAQFGPIKVPDERRDQRFLYLSDILPTAWQAVKYADVPEGRHARRPRPRPGRAVRHPDRPAARRRPGDRGRPRARAARAGRAARHRDPRPARGRRRRRGADRDDRRPRPRRRPRGGRHGGARLPAWPRPPRPRSACCPTRWPSRSSTRWRSTGSTPCTPRSRPCAAAAPCRSAASTAARSTRCR